MLEQAEVGVTTTVSGNTISISGVDETLLQVGMMVEFDDTIDNADVISRIIVSAGSLTVEDPLIVICHRAGN